MKKIMFNDRYGLTEAVLQRMKTVTRRLLKPTKPRSLANCLKGIKYECMVDEDENNYEAPYYVGEIVAVAQSYYSIMESGSKVLYKCNVGITEHKGWSNKMFVRADLMPHQIRILDVRAERLQDITDEDCLREGIRMLTPDFPEDFPIHSTHYVAADILGDTPREAFKVLIDKISGKGTWESNPYAWRIEFELIK